MGDDTKVYDQVDAALREAGLIDRRVMDTPGWQVATASIEKHIKERGRGILMGPIGKDTWSKWLHIQSHCLEDGHSLTHAKCELQLVEQVTAALRNANKT